MVPHTFALTISAVANGSTSPAIETIPPGGGTVSVTNGDFTITQTSPAGYSYPDVGDALNETTTWTFDFTSDSNFSSFSDLTPLSSAIITLSLTYITGISTDSLFPEGITGVRVDEIRNLPEPPWPTTGFVTLQFDLLNYYSSDDILSVFSSNDYGKIPMIYKDDAIVSYAKLDLNQVPEPGTLLLLGSGLFVISAYRNKFKK